MKLYIGCIADAVKHGRISRRTADALQESMQAQGIVDDEEAIAFLTSIGDELGRRQLNAIKQASINGILVAGANAHPRGPATGLMSWLTRDVTGYANHINVDKQYRALISRWWARNAEALSKLRTRGLGWTEDQALARDVILELHGVGTGNADARTYAQGLAETFEEARVMFNEAGGDIKRRQDYGSIQLHDRRRIAAAGEEKYVADTVPILDARRMYHEDGTRMTEAELPALVRAVYKTLTTDNAGLSMGRRAVKNRHQDPRILAFKPEFYAHYQSLYGPPDMIGALRQHLDTMAREIASMQILGPNPEMGYAALRANAGAAGAGRLRLLMADHVWSVLNNSINAPGSIRLANVAAGIRAVESASKLGGAYLSSMADWGTMALTAHYNGIPFTRVAKRYFDLIDPRNEEGRIFATRVGVVAQAWSGQAVGTNRMAEFVATRGMATKLSETTMRVSLLSAHTDAGRQAFGMEMMGVLADHLHLTLDQLDKEVPPLARMLRGYGITDRLWSELGKIETAGYKGVHYVSTEAILQSHAVTPATADKLVSRLLAMVDSEADFAIPVPDARVHGHLMQGTQRGTYVGELVRFGGLWRSFAVSILYSHMARGLYQGDPAKVGSYLASFFIATTLMGTLAYQAKQVAKGLDPMDWMDPRLWLAGMFQGGGMGIFGDFIQGSMRTRYGNSFLATLAGPGGALIEDVHALTLANIGALAEGSDPRLPRDMIQFAGRHLPFQSLWYTRAAFQRIVLDQLSQAADYTAANRSFRHQEAYWRDTYGVDFWWRPGEVTPERAPQASHR